MRSAKFNWKKSTDSHMFSPVKSLNLLLSPLVRIVFQFSCWPDQPTAICCSDVHNNHHHHRCRGATDEFFQVGACVQARETFRVEQLGLDGEDGKAHFSLDEVVLLFGLPSFALSTRWLMRYVDNVVLDIHGCLRLRRPTLLVVSEIGLCVCVFLSLCYSLNPESSVRLGSLVHFLLDLVSNSFFSSSFSAFSKILAGFSSPELYGTDATDSSIDI